MREKNCLRRLRMRSGLGVSACVALAVACCLPPPAQAGDFFSNFFGMFGGRPHRPSMPMPFNDDNPGEAPRARVNYGGPAWCVRTCDGRHFPVSGSDEPSRQASCNSLCPAGNAEVVYGNDIDHAATSSGKPYAQLPNAFRYRTEAVAGCTCTGKDQAGLASVPVESDPTLRKGDIVAGENGMVVASPATAKHAAANFTPLPPALQARFRHLPVVARE
jgi:Protein of unknown function (DUF2865)